MTENKIIRVYEDLPNWARGVVIVGGLAISYIVVSTIYKTIKSVPDAIKEQQKRNQMDADLKRRINQGQDPSYDESQYNILADEALVAFNNFRLDIIPCPTSFGIFCQSGSFRQIRPIIQQLKSDVDYLKLVQAFGKKTASKWFGDQTKSLPEFVRYQLNHYEIESLNEIMSDNGLTYQF
jgi:hypothetical protein